MNIKATVVCEERPTVPTWATFAIVELEGQLDRLRSGKACEPCRGSGEEGRTGPGGAYVRECACCRGTGLT